jgi:hypothetical protein
MVDRTAHSEKVSSGRAVNDDDSATEVSVVHPAKQLGEITVTDDGKMTDPSAVQPIKADSPIV